MLVFLLLYRLIRGRLSRKSFTLAPKMHSVQFRQLVKEIRITDNRLPVSDLELDLYIIQTTLENGKMAVQKVYKQ